MCWFPFEKVREEFAAFNGKKRVAKDPEVTLILLTLLIVFTTMRFTLDADPLVRHKGTSVLDVVQWAMINVVVVHDLCYAEGETIIREHRGGEGPRNSTKFLIPTLRAPLNLHARSLKTSRHHVCGSTKRAAEYVQ